MKYEDKVKDLYTIQTNFELFVLPQFYTIDVQQHLLLLRMLVVLAVNHNPGTTFENIQKLLSDLE